MRVLLTTHPGSGHLHPLIPLARALVAEGHEVAVATSELFCAQVEKLGLHSLPAGRAWLESDPSTLPGFVEATAPAQVGWFCDLARETEADLVLAARRWGADLVIRESMEFGGWLVAEALGLPCAVVGIVVALSAQTVDLISGGALAALAAERGVEVERSEGDLYVDLLPASMRPPGLPGPRSSIQLRPEPFDASGDEQVPDVVARRDGRPLVYATLGTVYNTRTDAFDLLVDAFDGLPADVLMTVGRDQDPGRWSGATANVHVERYVPQSRVLPHCSAAVTHGGCGTQLTALLNAVPTLVLPFSADQPFNAAITAAAGVGLSAANVDGEGGLGTTRVDLLEPAAVREQLVRLLSEPHFTDRCRSVRDELMDQPPLSAAVPLLERLVQPAAGAR